MAEPATRLSTPAAPRSTARALWTQLSHGLCGLLALGFLCWPALWNQQAFFFPDTPTYLRGAEMGLSRLLPPGSLQPWLSQTTATSATSATSATPDEPPAAPTAAPPARLTSVEDKVVLAGRSVYYGALLYLSHVSGVGSSLALTVLVQALCLVYVLHLLLVRLWGLRYGQFVGVVAGLSLFTPMAVYTGFLMPDIFAALLILCVALLVTAWPSLRRADRWGVSALLLYALMVHASHVVIGLCLLILLLLAQRLWPSWRLSASRQGLTTLAVCLLLAVAAEIAFTQAVTRTLGAPPLRLPHPMARLIDAGPGTDFLRANCPEAGYAACTYVQNYPTAWVDFLFSDQPKQGAFALADAATKRRMSEEQLRFVWDVTRADPLGVAGVVTADFLRQLIRFDTDIWSFAKDGIALYFQGRVPPDVLAQMQASRAAQSANYNIWFSISNRVAVLLALLLIAIAWPKRQQLFVPPASAVPGPLSSALPSAMPRAMRNALDTACAGTRLAQARARYTYFAGTVLAGIASNAFVCAALASSMDRFQARVIWLLPLVAVAGLLVWRAQEQGAPAAPTDSSASPESALLGAKP